MALPPNRANSPVSRPANAAPITSTNHRRRKDCATPLHFASTGGTLAIVVIQNGEIIDWTISTCGSIEEALRNAREVGDGNVLRGMGPGGFADGTGGVRRTRFNKSWMRVVLGNGCDRSPHGDLSENKKHRIFPGRSDEARGVLQGEFPWKLKRY